MSISGIGAGPVTAAENNASQRPQGVANQTPPANNSNQPLNARGRGQIVNLLV